MICQSAPDVCVEHYPQSSQNQRFDQAYAANQETSPAQYFYIGELISLFLKSSYASDPRFWDDALTELLVRIKQFRNDVMHPVGSLAALEGINALANLPRWATEVTEKLRDLAVFLDEARA